MVRWRCGALGIIAVLLRQEFYRLWGVVRGRTSFVIRRFAFKLCGQRIFRMAPIHHYYELKGCRNRVIVRFGLFTMLS